MPDRPLAEQAFQDRIVPDKVSSVSEEAALAAFTEYFVRNYPGPHTIIGDPHWHAPKIFRAALHALRSSAPRTSEEE